MHKKSMPATIVCMDNGDQNLENFLLRACFWHAEKSVEQALLHWLTWRRTIQKVHANIDVHMAVVWSGVAGH